MKDSVFIVFYGEPCEGSHILSVHKNKATAEKAHDEFMLDDSPWIVWVDEVEVQE